MIALRSWRSLTCAVVVGRWLDRLRRQLEAQMGPAAAAELGAQWRPGSAKGAWLWAEQSGIANAHALSRHLRMRGPASFPTRLGTGAMCTVCWRLLPSCEAGGWGD